MFELLEIFKPERFELVNANKRVVKRIKVMIKKAVKIYNFFIKKPLFSYF